MKKIFTILLVCIIFIISIPITGLAASKPVAPSINSYTAVSSSSIKIGWGKVSGATKYRVDRRRTDESNYKTLTSSCTATLYTDTGLKSGSTYYYRVYAINSAGTSARSVTYEAHTKPSTPTISSVNRDSATQMTLKWNSVSGATKYKIMYRRGDQADYQTLVTNATGTSYTHRNLTSNARYWYRVYAIREGDVGPEGNRSKKNIESDRSETLGNFTKIARPSNRTDNNNPTTVNLSWGKAYGNNDYSYDIYRKSPTDSGFKKIKRTKDLTYTDIGLTPGVIYKYKINTVVTSDGGSCTWSDDFYAAPKITKALNLTPQSATSMKISWDKPLSETGLQYLIYKWNGSSYDRYDTTTNTYYVDNNLKTGETYRYYIDVQDSSGKYLTSTYGNSAVLQILPTGVTLNKSSVSMAVADNVTISANITPSNSTNKNITWSSSNTNIATVSSAGIVTAKKIGSAVITVKTSNGKTASCSVNVTSCAHTYGGWIMDEEANCTKQGKRHRICSKCGNVDSEDIPMAEHSYKEEITEAGCLTDGSKENVCINCGYRMGKEIIPATGHSYPEEWSVECEATCEKEGSECRICSTCGTSESRVIEKKQHQYKLIKEVEPDDSVAGIRIYVCEICSDELEERWVYTKNEGTIEVGSAYAKTGDTVVLPIIIHDNPGIAGFTLRIHYDSSVLTPTIFNTDDESQYVLRGDLLKRNGSNVGRISVNLDDNANENSIVVTLYNNPLNITKDGDLFYLAFKVNGDASLGDHSIKIEYGEGDITSAELYYIMPQLINGQVSVVDFMRGDINKDGRVNTLDSTLLAQHLAHWTTAMFDEQQTKAADLYRDDRITIKDAVSLVQTLANVHNDEPQSTILLSSADLQTEKPIISVDNCVAAKDAYVDVPVSISNNSGIAGFDLKIDYDKEYLIPVDILPGEVLSSEVTSNLQQMDIDTSMLDYVTACSSDSDNSSDDGVLFKIRFYVKDNAVVNDVLSIGINDESELCSSNARQLDDIKADFSQGSIKVSEKSQTQLPLYEIKNVTMKLDNDTVVESIPARGNFDMDIKIHPLTDSPTSATLIVAEYNLHGRLLKLNQDEVLTENASEILQTVHIGESKDNISGIKVFIWDSIHGMRPVADSFRID